MSIGSTVRRLLGPYEQAVCSAYRSIFVNVPRCVEQMQHAIPRNSYVIDVGGGDGEIINKLLQIREDIRVVMIDLRQNIGAFIETNVLDRVERHPGTSLHEYRISGSTVGDVLLVSDVLHHVPTQERRAFLADCVSLTRPGGTLIFKDVARGRLTSFASVFADRYITGDKHVSLVDPEELIDLASSFGCLKVGDLLSSRELPNYAISFRAPPQADDEQQ